MQRERKLEETKRERERESKWRTHIRRERKIFI